MAATLTILNPDANGAFALEKVARADLVRIDIADTDLILTTKDGSRYLLPNAGIDAMGAAPPQVTFSDTSESLGQLISQVGVITDLNTPDSSPSTQTVALSKEEMEEKEKLEKELQEQLEKLQKELQVKDAEAQKQAEDFEKFKQEHAKDEARPLTQNTETAVEKILEAAKRIEENLKRGDNDFADPVNFQPPPSPATPPPGLPPPISLTPIVSINFGNVVGTTVAGNSFYGGGGAVGSESSAIIGARNPLQYSPATIDGTAGNDVIYTAGPLVGNPDPTTDRSNNAKEFLLNVAGYFTQLNDVRIGGVPAGVTFSGAADNGDGTFTIPASSVRDGVPVVMIYDIDAWRSTGSSTFDLAFTVSGQSARGQAFSTTQSFRFMYLDVTDVSQVTNQNLIYESMGQTKQIYILPTLGTPSIINSGNGDDMIYGGLAVDTITAGNGNNQIFADRGDDVVVTGNGNNTVSLGLGNNTLTSGSGNDTVTAGDGNQIINAGSGANLIALANGNNTITGGAGNDTLTTGDGDNIVSLGDGANSVTLGDGVQSVTTGSGSDTILTGIGAVTIAAGGGANDITTGGGGVVNITAGAGNDTIDVNGGGGTIAAGDGTNSVSATTGDYAITAGTGNDSVTVGGGNNTIDVAGGANTVVAGNGNNIIASGSGNDIFTLGNGNNYVTPGLGANSTTAGTGNNTLDYSNITTTAAIISLAAGTATGTGLNDSFTGIQNVNGTTQSDTITGTLSANIIHGQAGDDVITGNGGNDTLYGEDGNDTITGNTGNDIIFAGDGNNTVFTGTAGADFVYGGSGNNNFISQHAGVSYNGTNGAGLLAGQVNTIDYSATSGSMTINLLSGNGSGGAAEGDRYALSSTGFNTINRILAAGGSDTITGSNADDTISAGGGNNTLFGNGGNDTLTAGGGNDAFDGGSGTNILSGGGGSNVYIAGVGADTFITATSGSDSIRYNGSGAGVVMNIDSVTRSFVNSLGVTVNVAAYTGGNKAVTAADAASFSANDTYTVATGANTSIDEIYGSAFGDVIFGGTGTLQYYGGSGVDFFYGGSGAEVVSYSNGADRVDAGGGTDTFWSATPNGGTGGIATTVYLDGTADTNGNGTADFLDRGVGSLTSAGVAYNGFALGRSTTLISNFENLLGDTGNDYLVGNNNDNIIGGRTGTNTMFGLGGNDTIDATFGANTIDGGGGSDTVDFSNSFFTTGTTTVATVFLSDATFFGISDKAVFWGSNQNFQSRTGTATYSTITNVENITGSGLNDVLYGNSAGNFIRGGSGNDIIAGNGGADTLQGDSGDDVFLATTGQIAGVSVFNGGTGIDTVRSAGLVVTAGSVSNAKYAGIEVLETRNNSSGSAYSLNANDITGLADAGTASSVALHIDTGDTFTISTGAGTGALSSVVASSSSTLTTYYLYSDAGHTMADTTNRVAILDVYTGV